MSVVSRLGSPHKNGPQYFAAFAATLGNLIMGTCIGWSSPAGPLLKAEPAEDGFNMSDQQISWVGCLMPAGALLGKTVPALSQDVRVVFQAGRWADSSCPSWAGRAE